MCIGQIVALTANADQHHRDLCQYVGMSDFLAKPIDPDLLINTLLNGSDIKRIRTVVIYLLNAPGRISGC